MFGVLFIQLLASTEAIIALFPSQFVMQFSFFSPKKLQLENFWALLEQREEKLLKKFTLFFEAFHEKSLHC